MAIELTNCIAGNKILTFLLILTALVEGSEELVAIPYISQFRTNHASILDGNHSFLAIVGAVEPLHTLETKWQHLLTLTLTSSFKTQTDKVFSKSTMTMTTNTTSASSTNSSTCLFEGWALPQPKLNKRFTREQIGFLVEKYDEGERSGSKWTPPSSFRYVDDGADRKYRLLFRQWERSHTQAIFDSLLKITSRHLK